jgi:cytochrome c peroxidase
MSYPLVRRLLTAFVFFLSALVLTARSRDTEPPSPFKATARLRRPVALVPTQGGKRLVVANHESGTLSILDIEKREVVREVQVGRSLADLKHIPDGRLLAVDELAGELVVLQPGADGPVVVSRIGVGQSPVSVALATVGKATVACLWPHQLAVVALSADAPPRLERTIDLPFAPRLQLPIPRTDKLVVADAFGGRLAVVDVGLGRVESNRALPAHNIRGMAFGEGGKELLITHQVLTADTPTREDEVRWGNVISNMVRALSVDAILQPGADLLHSSRAYPLGDFLRGAADPAGLAVSGGQMIVALAGIGEVAVGSVEGKKLTRIPVARQPTAVVLSRDCTQAFVANTLNDSVAIVDLKNSKNISDISLGPSTELSAAQRGEVLFFDARLSREGWMSCHSCHTDGHTNGLRSDTLGDGSYGAPKRVPTLRGVADTAPWAWNGSFAQLRLQIEQSVRSTMHGRASERQVADLEAYLRTLPPPPPRAGRGKEWDAAVSRGQGVFQAQGCGRCHTPPTYTSARTYEVGKGTFNPPSLRGVSQGVAFFHDGRAASLEEVFTRFHHQVPPNLPRKDLDDLQAFLRTL